MGSGALSLSGGHLSVGRFARGKGARSYEARFSPSRSPFPGTSLFCAVVWGSVLANACMLLYWPCIAVPMVCVGRKAVCAADLFLVVVVLLVLTCYCLLLYCRRSLAPVCCRITGIDLLLSVVVLPTLTYFLLLSHHWHKPAPINNREQARCAGRFPVRWDKKIGSA